MDFIASLGCAAALVFGLLCLVKPAVLKRQSRWDGVAVLLLMPVMVGISLTANPKVSQPGETLESVRQGGIATMVFFGLLAISAFLIGLWVSAKPARIGGSARPELDLEESLRLQREWVAAQKSKPAAPKIPRKTWRDAWAEAKAKQEKAEQERAVRRAEVQAQREAAGARGAKVPAPSSVPEPKKSWFDRQQEKLDEKRKSEALMAEIRAKIEAEKAEGIGPRLERYYEKFRSGEITLEEYKAEVVEEQADTKEQLRLTRACRSDAARAGTLYEHEAEVEQLQEDLEECAWRLRWIKDQAYKQSISREGFDERGKWARFEYVDADGVITNRTIAMWEKRGAYIVGYDRSRKEERTFRQDRISDWISG